MRARYAGNCTSCATRIEAGEEIQILLGKWTHAACKAAAISARKEAAGPPMELEPAIPEMPVTEYVGTRTYRRRNQRFLRQAKRP